MTRGLALADTNGINFWLVLGTCSVCSEEGRWYMDGEEVGGRKARAGRQGQRQNKLEGGSHQACGRHQCAIPPYSMYTAVTNLWY